jgi:hypothetical protein
MMKRFADQAHCLVPHTPAHAYHRVVRIPFVPPKEQAMIPPAFHEAACVRCVEGGGAQWTLFDARDVGHFFAQDKYTCFLWRWPEGHKEQILDESLRCLEQRLAPFGFLRIHRQRLVNLRFVRQIKLIGSSDGARAVLRLQDGTLLTASRRGTRLLKQHLLRLAPKPSKATRSRRTTPCRGAAS